MSFVKAISRWNRNRLQRRHFKKERSAQAFSYADWVAMHATLSDGALSQLTQHGRQDGPKFSVVMPVYNADVSHLRAAVESVLCQTYGHFELCLADDASTDPAVGEELQRLQALDARIKVLRRPINGHISAASNSALTLASGDYVVLLDQDDLLASYALAAMAKAIELNPSAQLLYSDEDKIDGSGERKDPHFKPDWNLYLLRSQNYVCHLAVIKRSLVDAIGGFRVGFEGAQDHDLMLRCAERLRADEIVHVPLVLYHWRVHARSTAASTAVKPYATANGVRAVQEHLDRLGIAGRVEADGIYFRVRYALPAQPPRVSMILLTRDRPQLLATCVRSVLEKTAYPNLEVVIVDNGTVDPKALALLAEFAKDPRVKLVRDPSEFNFSALNNRAVATCSGDYLCLMNNDVEVLHADWLDEMVGVAIQSDVGAVGARLYYPDGRLQHAGVTLGIGGVAGHAFKLQTRDDSHYMGRSRLTQELSAVTAACMVTPKALYEAVGGLDEVNLKVAFNDFDYCLKVTKSGRKVVYTPYAELTHHESVSRGLEDTAEKKQRFTVERSHMIQAWADMLLKDRAYNPNLTLDKENFGLSMSPRMSPAIWFDLKV